MKKSNLLNDDSQPTTCCCVCIKSVSHKMQQVLFIVANLPIGYIRIRKEKLKNDYLNLLTATQAREAFLVMIEEKTIYEISEMGRACYHSMMDRAIKLK